MDENMHAPTPLKEIIEAALRTLPASKHLTPLLLYLMNEWTTLIGPTLAEHSIPYKIEDETLHVYIDHGPFAHTLHFALPQLSHKISSDFPSVNLQRIKTHPWKGPFPIALFTTRDPLKTVEDQPRIPMSELLGMLTESEQDSLIQLLETIEDMELKEVFLSSFVRQKISARNQSHGVENATT